MVEMPRRLLFVSGYFPPRGPIGAVRPGKLAQHWAKVGHDVRTIALALTPDSHSNPGQPANSTYYLPYRDPGKFVTDLKSSIVKSVVGQAVLGRTKTLQSKGTDSREAPAEAAPVAFHKHSLIDIYRQFVQFPDSYKSWIQPAVSMVSSWQEG